MRSGFSALDKNRTGALDNQHNCKMHPADKKDTRY